MNKIRDESWVLAKIEGWKPVATPEVPADATPAETPAPIFVADVPVKKEVPVVTIPTSTVRGKEIEYKDQVMTESLKETKKILDNAPRVMFMIPKMEWEEVGVYETVTINGYRMVIKKGMMMELPKPVFDLLAKKYAVEQSAGEANRLDMNPNKNPETQ